MFTFGQSIGFIAIMFGCLISGFCVGLVEGSYRERLSHQNKVLKNLKKN